MRIDKDNSITQIGIIFLPLKYFQIAKSANSKLEMVKGNKKRRIQKFLTLPAPVIII